MTRLAIQKLKDKVRCPVLQAGDDGYDEARVIWNGMIDRKPRLIVRCKGVADVIDAVNFARDYKRHALTGHEISGQTCNVFHPVRSI